MTHFMLISWDTFRYFEDDDETNADELEYQPAPDSPVLNRDGDGGNRGSDSDASDDPLEAFMAGIEVRASFATKG